MEIPRRIIDFISENDVLTLATCANNKPYCATVFYIFLEERNLLAFMSDAKTRHMREALENTMVAGTIIAKNVSVAKVQGLQFTGTLLQPDNTLREECSSKYLWAFPMAALHDSGLWAIDLSFLKLTDYRLGFGKKLTWEK